jgi:hypothetical protein
MQPPKPTTSPPAKTDTPVAPSAPGAPAAAAQTRTPLIIGGVAALVLACGLTLWAVAREGEPRLNDDTVALVKFVSSSAYAKLPFDRQAEYMKVLEDRDDNDELEAAFEAGKLSESEYRAGLMEAWLGQQVKRGEKYASLPPGPARDRYIWELLDKKEAKEARKAAKKKPDDAAPKVKRDKAQEDVRIAAWSEEARSKWDQYRRHYEAQKEAREAAAAAPAEKSTPAPKNAPAGT